jgi:2-polyprenyl-6-methoxyphenol hydroxylase-like FAD-dependent oxidoreductase
MAQTTSRTDEHAVERAADVVIAGAGPAGMMLAYQLASNGIPVRVIERHPDFEREFRGELVMPSALGILERIGALQRLVREGNARLNVERQLYAGPTRRVYPPGGRQVGAWVSQPALLRLLDEECRRFPGYRLDLDTTLRSVETGADGRVEALVARRRGGEEVRVGGGLFVVGTGRGDGVRRLFGRAIEAERMAADVLWLSLDFGDARHLLPSDVQVHMFGRDRVVVFFQTTASRLHVAFSTPEDVSALRRDPAALRARLAPMIPPGLREAVVARLDERTPSQVLRVSVDQLDDWHGPNWIFIGDAAHTMSPMAGQGLNAAIRDSVVLANHLIEAARAGRPAGGDLLAAVARERRPEIDALHEVQRRVHRIVKVPLPVMHAMFTLIGAVTKLAALRPAAAGVDAVEVRHPVPVSPTGVARPRPTSPDL